MSPSAQRLRRKKAIAAVKNVARSMQKTGPAPHPGMSRVSYLQRRPLLDEERRFLSIHGSKSEKDIEDGKKKMLTYQMMQFVGSFPVAFKGGQRSMAVELCDFNAENMSVVEFFRNSNNTYCHLPALLGKKHLVAMSVAVNQRKMLVCDSRGLITRACQRGNGDARFCFDELTFNLPKDGLATLMDGKEHLILDGEIVEKLHHAHEAVKSIEAAVHRKGMGEGGLERMRLKWSLQVVSSFHVQQNDTDCGVFDCLFFECLSRRLSTNVSSTQSAKFVKTGLGVYRQWLALSVCVGRILGCERDAKAIECEIVSIN